MPKHLSTALEWMRFKIRPVREIWSSIITRWRFAAKAAVPLIFFGSHTWGGPCCHPLCQAAVSSWDLSQQACVAWTVSHVVHGEFFWLQLAYLIQHPGFWGVEFLLHFPFVLETCSKCCFNTVVVSGLVWFCFFVALWALIFPKKKVTFKYTTRHPSIYMHTRVPAHIVIFKVIDWIRVPAASKYLMETGRIFFMHQWPQ